MKNQTESKTRILLSNKIKSRQLEIDELNSELKNISLLNNLDLSDYKEQEILKTRISILEFKILILKYSKSDIYNIIPFKGFLIKKVLKNKIDKIENELKLIILDEDILSFEVLKEKCRTIDLKIYLLKNMFEKLFTVTQVSIASFILLGSLTIGILIGNSLI